MATKPSTVFTQISELPKIHSIVLLEFKNWLVDEQDSSDVNAANYLKVLKLFTQHLDKKTLKDVEKEDILSFLDKRKKSTKDDPEKKWIRTWNDYLERLISFYKWLSNLDSLKDRIEWARY